MTQAVCIAIDPADWQVAAPRRRGGWFEARLPGGYMMARHWPARFDLSAGAAFPALHAGRLARQIRQDLWRLLRDLRGFSPAIRVDAASTGLYAVAGGALHSGCAAPSDTESRIAALLTDPAHRLRWSSWARKAGQA